MKMKQIFKKQFSAQILNSLPKKARWKVFPTNHAIKRSLERKIFIPQELSFTKDDVLFVTFKGEKPHSVGVEFQAYKNKKIVYVFSIENNLLNTVYTYEK
jgi:hypothetical protein